MRNLVSPIVSMRMETEPQGEAIGERVRDLRGSECRPVMGRIRGEFFLTTFPGLKGSRPLPGLSSRDTFGTVYKREFADKEQPQMLLARAWVSIEIYIACNCVS